VLLKSLCTDTWPIAIADALGVVKVRNNECGFLKSTPAAKRAHRRRRLLRHDQCAQPVRYEEHDIMRLTRGDGLGSHCAKRERPGKD
jgi:hypothetical protein